MNFKSNPLERFGDNKKIQEVVESYRTKISTFFEGMVNSPEDIVALEEMALEAASGSPEMQEAFKQVLMERKRVRDIEMQEMSKDLYLDEEGKMVHRSEVLSGEKQ